MRESGVANMAVEGWDGNETPFGTEGDDIIAVFAPPARVEGDEGLDSLVLKFNAAAGGTLVLGGDRISGIERAGNAVRRECGRLPTTSPSTIIGSAPMAFPSTRTPSPPARP